jgi:hypothetical protein
MGRYWSQFNPVVRSLVRLPVALLLLTLCATLAPGNALGAGFAATLDRDSVQVGDSLTLTLEFEGGTPKQIPSIPDIANLQVTAAGNSQNVSILNGQYSTTYSQTFVLSPRQPGTYTIPALKVQMNGQTLSSQPLTFKALPADAAATDQSGQQLAFFKLQLPRKEVYFGEVFMVVFQVAVRENVVNHENILQNFDGYNECPLKVEDCTVLRTAHMQRQRVRLGNDIYGVSTLVTALSPVKTGPLTIGSIDVNLTLQLPAANQRRRDPFMDPFGMFQQVEEKRVTLSADPQQVTVLPLPKDNVPPNFNGAVGSYTMAVSAGPTNVAAGDPITVRVQIKGKGALDSLALPEQASWSNFKTYPPTTKVEPSDALGLEGSKTFEQVVVPQNADLTELPPVCFSFFDPELKQYRTLTQPAIPLVVRPGGSTPAPTTLAGTRPAQENSPATQDIVPNKQRLGAVLPAQPPLLRQSWFIALQGVPVLAFVLALVWRRHADALANHPRLRRRRQTDRVIHDGLAQMRHLARQNKSDEFFATLFHLIQERLGERLDVPSSAITEAVIEEHLRPCGVESSTLTSLQELFQACNLARYAPPGNPQELAAFIPRLETLLSELERLNA